MATPLVGDLELIEHVGIECDAAVHSAGNERPDVHDQRDSRSVVGIGESVDVGDVGERVVDDGRRVLMVGSSRRFKRIERDRECEQKDRRHPFRWLRSSLMESPLWIGVRCADRVVDEAGNRRRVRWRRVRAYDGAGTETRRPASVEALREHHRADDRDDGGGYERCDSRDARESGAPPQPRSTVNDGEA